MTSSSELFSFRDIDIGIRSTEKSNHLLNDRALQLFHITVHCARMQNINTAPNAKGRRASHYSQVSHSHFMCKRCGVTIIKSGSSTSPLLTHPRHCVPEFSPSNTKKPQTLLMSLIHKGLLSFRTLDDADFIQLLLGPPLSPPSSISAKSIVMADYQRLRADLRRRVSQLPYWCIGIDIYTTPSFITFLGVSCHGVEDHHPISALLALERVKGDVNSVAVGIALSDVLSGLPRSPLFGISDGSSREQKCLSARGIPIMSCVCHVLNLAVTDVLPSCPSAREQPKKKLGLTTQDTQQWFTVTKLQNEVMNLCTYFRSNSKTTPIPYLPPCPNSTRWTSCFTCMKAVQDCLGFIAQPKKDALMSQPNQMALKDIVDVLVHINEAVVKLQAPNSTLMLLRPLISVCIRRLQSLQPVTPTGKFVQRLIVRRIRVRMSRVLGCDTVALASFFNPQLRDSLNSQQMNLLHTLAPAPSTPPHDCELYPGLATRNPADTWTLCGPTRCTDSMTLFASDPTNFGRLGEFLSAAPCSNAFLEGCFSHLTRVCSSAPHGSPELLAARTFLAVAATVK